MKIRWLGMLGLLVVALCLYYLPVRSDLIAGITVQEAPVVHLVAEGVPWSQNHYTITPLASISMRGRVLHAATYHDGKGADLAPLDLGLGWGLLSNREVYSQLNFSQQNRWIFWGYHSWRQPILSNAYIVYHMKNVHIIPGNAQVRQAAATIRVNDIVRLSGYLVSARDKDNEIWRSAVSLGSSGVGACFLMWVDSLVVEPG
jgi:hypothetical protein